MARQSQQRGKKGSSSALLNIQRIGTERINHFLTKYCLKQSVYQLFHENETLLNKVPTMLERGGAIGPEREDKKTGRSDQAGPSEEEPKWPTCFAAEQPNTTFQ